MHGCESFPNICLGVSCGSTIDPVSASFSRSRLVILVHYHTSLHLSLSTPECCFYAYIHWQFRMIDKVQCRIVHYFKIYSFWLRNDFFLEVKRIQIGTSAFFIYSHWIDVSSTLYKSLKYSCFIIIIKYLTYAKKSIVYKILCIKYIS